MTKWSHQKMVYYSGRIHQPEQNVVGNPRNKSAAFLDPVQARVLLVPQLGAQQAGQVVVVGKETTAT
jgi:hypothetical protein